MFFPTMIELQDKAILIVGGGVVAYRKAKVMLEFGGIIYIVSSEISDEFIKMSKDYKEEERLILIKDEYNKSYIKNKFMVIAATSSREVNREVVADCKDSGILASNVDGRDDSDFINPGIYKNDNLTISISTGGSFPYLTKKIRREIEEKYKKYDDEFLSVLEDVRYGIIKKHPDKKRQIMDKILGLEIDDLKKFQEEINKVEES